MATVTLAVTCRITPDGWQAGVTGGFLYDLGVVSYTIRIPCILIVHVSCFEQSVPFGYIKIHRDTTYIEIQQDTFVSHFGHQRKCILPRDMYPSLRNIQDKNAYFKKQSILTLHAG